MTLTQQMIDNARAVQNQLRDSVHSNDHEAAKLLDCVVNAVATPEWQPIETAPKDGTHVILSNGSSVAQGWWQHEEPSCRDLRDTEGEYLDQVEHDGYDGWFDCEGGMLPDPTHWRPLPAAPALAAKEQP